MLELSSQLSSTPRSVESPVDSASQTVPGSTDSPSIKDANSTLNQSNSNARGLTTTPVESTEKGDFGYSEYPIIDPEEQVSTVLTPVIDSFSNWYTDPSITEQTAPVTGDSAKVVEVLQSSTPSVEEISTPKFWFPDFGPEKNPVDVEVSEIPLSSTTENSASHPDKTTHEDKETRSTIQTPEEDNNVTGITPSHNRTHSAETDAAQTLSQSEKSTVAPDAHTDGNVVDGVNISLAHQTTKSISAIETTERVTGSGEDLTEAEAPALQNGATSAAVTSSTPVSVVTTGVFVTAQRQTLSTNSDSSHFQSAVTTISNSDRTDRVPISQSERTSRTRPPSDRTSESVSTDSYSDISTNSVDQIPTVSTTLIDILTTGSRSTDQPASGQPSAPGSDPSTRPTAMNRTDSSTSPTLTLTATDISEHILTSQGTATSTGLPQTTHYKPYESTNSLGKVTKTTPLPMETTVKQVTKPKATDSLLRETTILYTLTPPRTYTPSDSTTNVIDRTPQGQINITTEANQSGHTGVLTTPTIVGTSENATAAPSTTRDATFSTSARESITIVRTTKSPSATQEGKAEPSTTPELKTESSTTSEPKAESSTTQELKAEASTSQKPQTALSTTQESKTESSTTQEPKTEPSTTQEPNTESTTQEPKTEPSTTQEPNTESSTTPEPKTDSSTTQESTTEPSTTQESKTESSATQEPKTESSTTEEPKTESSTTQEAKTEPPTTRTGRTTTTHPPDPSTDITFHTGPITTWSTVIWTMTGL